MKRALAASAIALVLLAAPSWAWSGHGVHWGYEGNAGPRHWGDLDPLRRTK